MMLQFQLGNERAAPLLFQLRERIFVCVCVCVCVCEREREREKEKERERERDAAHEKV